MSHRNILYLESDKHLASLLETKLHHIARHKRILEYTHVECAYDAIISAGFYDFTHFIFDMEVPFDTGEPIKNPLQGLLALNDARYRYEDEGRKLPKIAINSEQFEVDHPDMNYFKKQGAIYLPKNPSEEALDKFLDIY